MDFIIRRLLRIHLDDGRLLKMARDNIPNVTALISQPEDICSPVMTFLPSRLRPKLSPCFPERVSLLVDLPSSPLPWLCVITFYFQHVSLIPPCSILPRPRTLCS